MRRFLGLLISCAALSACATTAPQLESGRLATALKRLASEGTFSGAIVIREGDEVRFAKGYGWADPFARLPFTPATPVDSASLAKPVTAAAILLMSREGRIDLDAPVVRYLTDFPHPDTTVRQLLTHSAGMPSHKLIEPVAGKTNFDILSEVKSRGIAPAFRQGTAFSYCNMCYDSLALLLERVAGRSYTEFAIGRLWLPSSAHVRPKALANWHGRAVGFRAAAEGDLLHADSYEGEAFYGSANLSMSAADLSEWGARWWSNLAPLRALATSSAPIGNGVSGLTLGNWYCAPERTRCHYLGHHEGFHHMLYFDTARRLSVAMVTNNSLAPEFQQRLKRGLVAFANGQSDAGWTELSKRLPQRAASPGFYRTTSGEIVQLTPGDGSIRRLTRRGVTYDVYPVGNGVGYAPGLDVYMARSEAGLLHLLSMYEDEEARYLGTD